MTIHVWGYTFQNIYAILMKSYDTLDALGDGGILAITFWRSTKFDKVRFVKSLVAS